MTPILSNEAYLKEFRVYSRYYLLGVILPLMTVLNLSAIFSVELFDAAVDDRYTIVTELVIMDLAIFATQVWLFDLTRVEQQTPEWCWKKSRKVFLVGLIQFFLICGGVAAFSQFLKLQSTLPRSDFIVLGIVIFTMIRGLYGLSELMFRFADIEDEDGVPVPEE